LRAGWALDVLFQNPAATTILGDITLTYALIIRKFLS
jgi:hypothetical protein